MTQTITTRCDFCGRTKGESNHWFTLIVFHVNEGGQVTATLQVSTHDKKITVLPGDTTAKDACGHDCVVQGVARYMDHGTLEPERGSSSD